MKGMVRTGIFLVALGVIAITAPGMMASPQSTNGKTWTGVVSDSICGLKHSDPSDEAAMCVKKCVEGGAKYVLVSRGKVYQLSDQSKFAAFAGRSVKVSGTLHGNAIQVASVSGL
jgi:hypothetical protein